MIKLFSKFIRCSRGVSALEFVLFLPLLLLLLMASVEVSRYLIIMQKVDKTANTIAYIITQTLPNDPDSPPQDWRMTRSEVLNTANLFEELMQPYWDDSAGVVSVVSFTQDNVRTTNPIIDWSVTGGGTYRGANMVSDITGRSIYAPANTIEGTPVQISRNLETSINIWTNGFYEGENVIVVEVFYEFRSIFASNIFDFGTHLIKGNAYAAPRNGNLSIIADI